VGHRSLRRQFKSRQTDTCFSAWVNSMRSIVTVTTPDAFARLGGIAIWQRAVRTLRLLGSEKVQVLSSFPLSDFGHQGGTSSSKDLEGDEGLIELEQAPVTGTDIAAAIANVAEPVLIVPGDSVFDARILSACMSSSEPVVCVDSDPPKELTSLIEDTPECAGGRVCGPAVVTSGWLQSHRSDLYQALRTAAAQESYPAIDIARLDTRAPELRRDLRPFWFPAPDRKNLGGARQLLLASTQKGSLDLPAMLHAPVEKVLAWFLAATRITPNGITLLTTVLAWLATGLFVQGLVKWGLLFALIVGVLDGVDGKLARLRLEFSKFGELEHWLDFLYEWSWWAALAHFLSSSSLLPQAWTYFGLLALFELLDGLAKLINIRWFGRLIDEMSPFERSVRILGGRRNIYVWLMVIGALLGKPEASFKLLPVWQGVTALLHWIRLPWLFAHRQTRFRSEGEAHDD